MLLMAAVGGGGLLFLEAIASAKSAPQEAAAGAVYSTIFIGLYILARCVEKLTAALERTRSR